MGRYHTPGEQVACIAGILTPWVIRPAAAILALGTALIVAMVAIGPCGSLAPGCAPAARPVRLTARASQCVPPPEEAFPRR